MHGYKLPSKYTREIFCMCRLRESLVMGKGLRIRDIPELQGQASLPPCPRLSLFLETDRPHQGAILDLKYG
jgi:hypothetical protein